jgi:predicted RNA-binding protein
MNQIECDAVPSDFDDEWRRLRFAHAQSKFEHNLNGVVARDITQSAKPMVYYAGPA